MKTTLNQIKAHNPCESGYKKLLKFLGKAKADDEPLPLALILQSNGLDDALWCLRAVTGYDKEIRLFAVACARHVQHLNPDPRVAKCLDVAEAYAKGCATQEELDAARDATRAAWDAAGDAARYAARAAWAAAWAAAGAVRAAWYAAGAAARDAALAAGDAAWAAWDAAGDAARYATWDAAWYAERKYQEQLFLEMVK